jgi:hypothetical protein
MRKTLAVVVLSIIAGLGGGGGLPAPTVDATHTTRTYVLESPLGVTAWVSSPPRFHNQCAYTAYVDDPHFDDGTCKGASNVNGNWSIDLWISSTSGQLVYLDINPQAIDGFSAGGTYRVVAGDSNNWNGGTGNDQYQYFGIHSWNFTTGAWENYAWIVLGHIDTLQYSSGSIICDTRTTPCTAYVAKIAPGPTPYPTHLHMEVKNYVDGAAWISRAYDWDGPSNAQDSTLSGPCSRTANPNVSTCNTQMWSTDGVGYVGGSRTTFAELNNPYFLDF